MRILRLIVLIVALLVGQAQAGRAVYVCVDGGVCKRCSSELTEGHDRVCEAVTKKPVDKKNCCKAKPANDHHDSEKSTSFHSVELVIGLPVTEIRVALPEAALTSPAPRIRYVSYLPHSPPSERYLRAPPILPT